MALMFLQAISTWFTFVLCVEPAPPILENNCIRRDQIETAHRSLCHVQRPTRKSHLSRLNPKRRRNQDHTQHQRKESTGHEPLFPTQGRPPRANSPHHPLLEPSANPPCLRQRLHILPPNRHHHRHRKPFQIAQDPHPQSCRNQHTAAMHRKRRNHCHGHHQPPRLRQIRVITRRLSKLHEIEGEPRTLQSQKCNK